MDMTPHLWKSSGRKQRNKQNRKTNPKHHEHKRGRLGRGRDLGVWGWGEGWKQNVNMIQMHYGHVGKYRNELVKYNC